MKPASFDYHRPQSLAEALALLERFGGDAKVLAGGQSLVPAMNFRLARPAVLVDLNQLGELDYVRKDGGGLRIGAMTRQRAVERDKDIAALSPLLHETMPWIAHPQIRNRGTIGGSLAHADPAAELPAVMLALEAQLVLRSNTDTRTLSAGDFYTGLFSTALASSELLVEVAIPALAPGTGTAFVEVARRHGDFALVGVAALLTLDQSNRCSRARIALLSVGDGPVLAGNAAAALAGRALDAATIEAASRAAAESDVDPPGDIHASSAYRRHLVRVLVGRALTLAAQRARPNAS
jgi:CO/xanthine dehydrogenase FAD-binding subunit